MQASILHVVLNYGAGTDPEPYKSATDTVGIGLHGVYILYTNMFIVSLTDFVEDIQISPICVIVKPAIV